ncbi:MAG TPA: TonB-dependent receptor [Thermoanaerobaculia bacterium]|nr:TonB-dependent receptor [Thermoanaerobaculia bacterium]
MLRGRGLLLYLLVSLMLGAGAAFAAETGSISGVVRSADGSGLPGVTVTVKGPFLPAGRSAVTSADGAFSFQRLPPGSYDVTAELQGLGNASRPAVVELEKDTQLELTLKPTLQGEITVSAALPTIDVKSTEAQVNFTAEQIEELPIPRTYSGLFELAPGVSQNGRLAPNAGGSRLDNTFLVDGINVTNPDFGDIFPDITQLDISEVSLIRGGISAEFGRAGGMVVNAITRAGTNRFGGEARYEYQPASFVSANKNSTVKNTTDQDFAGISLGGPLVHDHFWFYGSASRPSITTTDRTNNLGSVPDEKLITKEYFGKLTANPTEQHFLTFGLRHRDRTDENANITSTSSPTVGSNDFRNYSLGTFTWTWTLSADTFTEFKYNRDRENNGTNPLADLGYQPAFNAARPDLVGNFTSTPDFPVGGATGVGQSVGGASLAVNNQNFQRDELRGTYQTFKEFGSTRHDLRAGGTYEMDLEELERRANGWGTITWNPTTRQFTASYVSAQPPHTGRGRSYGVFGQDQMSLGERTTITAGLLVNKDEYFGEVFGAIPNTKREKKILDFDWGQELQPRLGIAFVPSVQRGDKLYANFGRYYNTDNKSLGRAGSPTRIFTTRATFDAAGHLISSVPQANTQTKTIDSGLDPQYTDEFLVGYARPLGNAWTAELWGMYRKVGNIFEDISADGLGNGPFHVAQLPGAYRRYKAVTLEATRRPVSDRFFRPWINFSYTWSRLTGNWDIDFGGDSPFYNSSFIQDGPGVKITDNRDGILRGDRTHDAKLFATIHPVEPLTLGTFIHFQSGGAWEARGLPDPNVSSSSYVRYLEKAGSRRMPDWTSADLLTSWDFKLGGIGLQLEGRVTNLFDQQVPLAVDDRLILGRPADNKPNNPNFGQGTVFTSPRTFVLSAIVHY